MKVTKRSVRAALEPLAKEGTTKIEAFGYTVQRVAKMTGLSFGYLQVVVSRNGITLASGKINDIVNIIYHALRGAN